MYTQTHIDLLRAQVQRAQAELAGWQGLLLVAAGCACKMPGTPGTRHDLDACRAIEVNALGRPVASNRNPYPAETGLFPAYPPGPAPIGDGLSAEKNAAANRFNEAHDKVCRAGDPDNPNADFCVLDRGDHPDRRHDDGLGHTWPVQERP
ncbi:hypothetical protein [Herbidospora mongoliensis]|uniref:hypothetical protein n=1 Tax=Herbidospora mongoliensis TaxID=688067 RepID=UPI000830A4C1|nr:hypothetical protein [Herbidospora mongoliensis]